MSDEAFKTIASGENIRRKNGYSPVVVESGKVPECVPRRNGILHSFGLAHSRKRCREFCQTGARSSEKKITLQKIP